MVGETTNGDVLEGQFGHLLDALSNAESLLGRQEISFPRIAVFGDESSGKSSMLEAICKVPFPQGNKTTTRCPTLLQLKRKPGVKWSASAWLYRSGKREGEARTERTEELERLIANLQSKVLGTGTKFSGEPITVSIEAENTVDLTLVDLPGYFTHEGLEDGEGTGAVDVIKETLLSFLSDKNTIALIVVPANQLVKTVNIFNLLKDYEKQLTKSEKFHFRARTIYCLTKCDFVGEPGTTFAASYDIEQLLYNEGTFATRSHGWYAVVNNGTKDENPKVDFLTRLARDRDFEKKFFDDTPPYNNVKLRSRCGADNLIKKLARILTEKISKVAPNLLAKTAQVRSKAKNELKSLEAAFPKEPNHIDDFHTIIGDIKTYYINATEGMYGDLNSRARSLVEPTPKEELEKCKLAYRRNIRSKKFAIHIEASRLPLSDQKYQETLQEKVESAVNGKFDYTIPIPEVVFEEVRDCVEKWRTLAEALCNDIADDALECLRILVSMMTKNYAKLSDLLNTHFEKMIEEQRSKALTRLEWHCVDETMRPDTLNKLFEERIEEIKNLPGLGKNRKDNREAYIGNLEVYFPIAEARFIDNAVRTITTHIFDVPGGKARSRVSSDKAPTYTFQVPTICETEDIEAIMEIRGDLTEKYEQVTGTLNALDGLRDALRQFPVTNAIISPELNANYQQDHLNNNENANDDYNDQDGIPANFEYDEKQSERSTDYDSTNATSEYNVVEERKNSQSDETPPSSHHQHQQQKTNHRAQRRTDQAQGTTHTSNNQVSQDRERQGYVEWTNPIVRFGSGRRRNQ